MGALAVFLGMALLVQVVWIAKSEKSHQAVTSIIAWHTDVLDRQERELKLLRSQINKNLDNIKKLRLM